MKKVMRKDLSEGGDLFYDLKRRMGNIFDDFFGELEHSSLVRSDFVPSVNIEEDEKHYYVKAEIPGADKDHIDVSVKDRLLTIKGEKKEEREEKDKEGKKVFLRERVYGSFERTFTLGETVDAAHCEAQFKDGVLNLVLPKIVDEKTKKKITIQ